MPLTPNDIANKQFGRGMRGYVIEEVDAFLDEVEAEISRLLGDNARLTQRLSGLASTPAPAPVAQPAGAPPAGETQEAALRTLLMAQRTADQAVAEARAEADAILADSKAKAAQTETELNARIIAARSQLEREHKDVQARVDDLKAYEREYRMRLRAYLEGQLRELDTRGGGEGPGAGVPAASRTAAVGVMPEGVTDPAAARPAAAAPPVAVAPPRPPAPPAAPPPAPPAPPAQPAPPAPPAQPSVPLAPPAAPPQAVAPSEPFVLDAEPAPSGPPRQAIPPTPTVGPFTTPAINPLEQIDEGPEPPAPA